MYDKINDLVCGVIATGVNVYHPPRPLASAAASQTTTISSTQPPSQGIAPSTPHSRRRIRANSDTNEDDPGTSRRVRPRNADAMSAVATSLRAISDSFSAPSADSSPARRRRATKLLLEDSLFDDDMESAALALFADDSASIDIFMELPTAEKHANFVRRRLQNK